MDERLGRPSTTFVGSMKRPVESYNDDDGLCYSKKTKSLPEEVPTEEALKSMRLKKIIKENHGDDLNHVAFNSVDPDCYNLVAVVGGSQLNVYDSTHCGPYMDLMMQYDHSGGTEGTPVTFKSVTWLRAADPNDNDALVALGGSDKMIYVASIALSRIVTVLEGHLGPIIDLTVHPLHKHFLLSVSTDRTVRLWNVSTQRCNAIFEANALSACFSSDGAHVLTGGHGGVLRRWALNPEWFSSITKGSPLSIHPTDSLRLRKLHFADVDCLVSLHSGSFLSKSVDGKMFLWKYGADNPTALAELESQIMWKIPNCRGHRSKFSLSLDERYLVVGNSVGVIFLKDLLDVKSSYLTRLEYKRSKSPVSAVAINWNCRHVVMVGSASLIWSWRYAPPLDDDEG